MKKRFKIITTIASLCLAVTLMAFGVYAATQSTMEISSRVTFVAKDIQVTWNWHVRKGLPGSQTKVATGEVATTEADNGKEHIADDKVDEETYIPETIAFEAKNNYTITYFFSCTNNAGAPVVVDVKMYGQFWVIDGNVEVTYYQITGGEDYIADEDCALPGDSAIITEWEDLETPIQKDGTVMFAVNIKLIDCTLPLGMSSESLMGEFIAQKYVES